MCRQRHQLECYALVNVLEWLINWSCLYNNSQVTFPQIYPRTDLQHAALAQLSGMWLDLQSKPTWIYCTFFCGKSLGVQISYSLLSQCKTQQARMQSVLRMEVSMVTTLPKRDWAGKGTVWGAYILLIASGNLRTFPACQLVLITKNKWWHLVRFMGLLQSEWARFRQSNLWLCGAVNPKLSHYYH